MGDSMASGRLRVIVREDRSQGHVLEAMKSKSSSGSSQQSRGCSYGPTKVIVREDTKRLDELTAMKSSDSSGQSAQSKDGVFHPLASKSDTLRRRPIEAGSSASQ